MHVWLHSHSGAKSTKYVLHPAEDVGIPEVDKANEINARVCKFRVLIADVLLLQTTLPETHIAMQRQAYVKARFKHNSEMKATETQKRAIKRGLDFDAIEQTVKRARLEV